VDEFLIAYQDPWIVVVDKPVGQPTQSTPKTPLGLYENLQNRFTYVGMHHRLDQPTSGLVLFSLSQTINSAISDLFKRREIRRSYAAVLAGTLNEPRTWSTPLEGRKAVSHVLPQGHLNGMSAVHIQLDTGRTHQIRKHAAFHQTPLLGDRRYGAQWGCAWPRLALHAYRLEFTHPKTQKPISIQSPTPSDLKELWTLAGGS